MRLKHVKGAEEAIAANEYVVHDAKERPGKWQELFGNDHPIHIEIGMGKGQFLMELARRNPDINYLGMERYSSVLLRALQKMEEEPLPNLYFLCEDAAELPEMFANGELNRIYLNFSDPWPKDRHAKRRLTSPVFLEVYDKILKPDGLLEFKTDNRGLFEYSLESIPASGWNILASTFDLHHSDMAQGNVMTEYETKFASEGKPICKLIASRAKSV